MSRDAILLTAWAAFAVLMFVRTATGSSSCDARNALGSIMLTAISEGFAYYEPVLR